MTIVSIEMVPVISSNVMAVGYDVEQKELHVQFKGSTTVYIYESVESLVHQSLMASDSKGTFIARELKGKYKFKKVK
jgi:KTSC domain